jgi:parallel beta-helix repeat protein
MTPKKILILAANPIQTPHLRLDEEVREIEEGLRRSKLRDHFDLVPKMAVRPHDVTRALLDEKPQIVHFSGHGAKEDGLVLENWEGKAQLVGTHALANLFKLFSDRVECILLNACYSQVQATAIAQHIDFTIGMNKAIGDKAAIAFAVGFYDALGAGEDYEFAYQLGCNAIHMAGFDEYLTPDLIHLINRGEQAPPAKVVPSSVTNFSRIIPTPTLTVSSSKEVQTLVVSAMGRGNYRTISEAMKAAKEGAKILVKEGIYREGLVINKPVEIIGDGETSEIILEYSDGNCIFMKTDYAKVKGLTICGQSGLKGKEYFAVNIPQGCLVLEDCDITSDSLCCIGIYGLTAKPRIICCKIHDSKGVGIIVYQKGQGIVENCDIFGNTFAGVEIKEEANPTIRRCKIHDGKQSGILVHTKGYGIVEDCDIFANTYQGVAITEEGNPIIQKCRINRNEYQAICSHDNGRGTVENCDLTDNKGGVFYIDSTSQVQQSNNKT